LASAVVQVFIAPPNARNRWEKICVGVASFVKDSNKRSYFIRVYDVYTTQMLFEQEMYRQFEYKPLRAYFHSFESDDGVIGLNFSDEEEARIFQVCLVVVI
jgi:Wiskott-Aldrich syndrome protein